jgi:hypothetical protein
MISGDSLGIQKIIKNAARLIEALHYCCPLPLLLLATLVDDNCWRHLLAAAEAAVGG